MKSPLAETQDYCAELRSQNTRLVEALREWRMVESPGRWGTLQAWIVNGAPNREIGISAAKIITALNVATDSLLAEIKQEGKS